MKRANIFTAMGLALAFTGPVAQAQTAPVISADAQAALKLAEELFPQLFAGTGTALTFHAQLGYTYRYYASTGVYVGFKDGHVFVKGPQFGTDIYDKGAEGTVLAKLKDIKANVSAPNGCDEAVTGQLGCGEWDIKISGTVSQTIFGMTTVVDLDDLVVEDVPMENPTSEDEIEDILNEYYKDIGTIRDLEVVIVTNTDDHIILDLAFKATITQQGITINQTYDLRYDMTKDD